MTTIMMQERAGRARPLWLCQLCRVFTNVSPFPWYRVTRTLLTCLSKKFKVYEHSLSVAQCAASASASEQPGLELSDGAKTILGSLASSRRIRGTSGLPAVYWSVVPWVSHQTVMHAYAYVITDIDL